MRRLAALDCATPYESVALLEGGEVVAEHGAVRPRGAGPTVLDGIAALLADAGWTLRQLDGLVCGLGPGSFTGLRVALATAKGLALARDLPLWGVSTVAALQAALPGERVVAVLDAKRGEVFVGGEGVELACLKPETVRIAGAAPVLLGNGARLHAEALRAAVPGARIPESAALHLPRAALLVGAVGARPPDVLAALEPIYVRKSDAEINYPDGFPDARAVPVQALPAKRRPGRPPTER